MASYALPPGADPAAESISGSVSPLFTLLRNMAVGVASLVVVAALALAALAAAGIGLLVTMAALVVGLAGRRRAPRQPEVLEARRTPAGWVVEAK